MDNALWRDHEVFVPFLLPSTTSGKFPQIESKNSSNDTTGFNYLKSTMCTRKTHDSFAHCEPCPPSTLLFLKGRCCDISLSPVSFAPDSCFRSAAIICAWLIPPLTSSRRPFMATNFVQERVGDEGDLG